MLEHVVPQSAKEPEPVDTHHEDPDSDIQEIVRDQLQNQRYPPGFDMEEDDVSPEFANDPLFKLLKELNSSMGAEGDPSAGGMPMDFDPSKLFASMPGMGNFEGMSNPGAPPPPTMAPAPSRANVVADLIWTLVHLISMITLAMYAGLHKGGKVIFNDEDSIEASVTEASPARLLWYFATAELILQTSRFFMEAHLPPAPSKIANYASLLPQPFAGYIITGLRYLRILRTMAQDFCLLLFIAGVASYLN